MTPEEIAKVLDENLDVAYMEGYGDVAFCNDMSDLAEAITLLIRKAQADAWDRGFLADTLMRANNDEQAPTNPYRNEAPND